MQWRIKEFANMAGTTSRALRHYDDEAILMPSSRSESSYRIYNENDLKKIKKIMVLKRFGLDLKEIRIFLDKKHVNHKEKKLLDILVKRAMSLRSKAKEIDSALLYIGKIIEKYNITEGYPNILSETDDLWDKAFDELSKGD